MSWLTQLTGCFILPLPQSPKPDAAVVSTCEKCVRKLEAELAAPPSKSRIAPPSYAARSRELEVVYTQVFARQRGLAAAAQMFSDRIAEAEQGPSVPLTSKQPSAGITPPWLDTVVRLADSEVELRSRLAWYSTGIARLRLLGKVTGSTGADKVAANIARVQLEAFNESDKMLRHLSKRRAELLGNSTTAAAAAAAGAIDAGVARCVLLCATQCLAELKAIEFDGALDKVTAPFAVLSAAAEDTFEMLVHQHRLDWITPVNELRRVRAAAVTKAEATPAFRHHARVCSPFAILPLSLPSVPPCCTQSRRQFRANTGIDGHNVGDSTISISHFPLVLQTHGWGGKVRRAVAEQCKVNSSLAAAALQRALWSAEPYHWAKGLTFARLRWGQGAVVLLAARGLNDLGAAVKRASDEADAAVVHALEQDPSSKLL